MKMIQTPNIRAPRIQTLIWCWAARTSTCSRLCVLGTRALMFVLVDRKSCHQKHGQSGRTCQSLAGIVQLIILWPKVFNAVNVDVSKFKDYTSRTQWPTQITVAAVGANLLLNRWTATFLAVEQLAAADERLVWWRFPHPVESMDLPKKLET